MVSLAPLRIDLAQTGGNFANEEGVELFLDFRGRRVRPTRASTHSAASPR